MTVAVASVANQYDDTTVLETGSPPLYSKNTGYALAELVLGPDIKFNYFSSLGLIFRGLNIPAGSAINSASVDLEVTSAPSGVDPFVLISSLSKDGYWDPAAGRPGWTTSPTVDLGMRTLNAGLSDIGTSWLTPLETAAWPFRFFGSFQSLQLSQSITATATDSMKYADVRLRKAGAPTGNVWMEIWSDNGDDTPNALLGQSENVDVSTLTTAANCDPATRFTFSSAVPVTSGTKYIHVVNGDWSIFSGHVQWSNKISSDPYANGKGATYGTGFGNQYQNAMSNADWYTRMVAAASPHLGCSVAWLVPGASIGSVTTTPDLTKQIQCVVNDPIYVQDDPLGIILTEWIFGSPQGRRFFSSFTGTGAAPKLTIDYTAPPYEVIDLDSEITTSLDLDSEITTDLEIGSEITTAMEFDSEIATSLEFPSEISTTMEFDSEINMEGP